MGFTGREWIIAALGAVVIVFVGWVLLVFAIVSLS